MIAKSTFTKAVPPGPKRSSALNSLAKFCFTPMSFFEDIAGKYGAIALLPLVVAAVYFFNSTEQIKDIFVTHPAQFRRNRILERARKLMGNGLITSDGAEHIRQRRLLQPSFHQYRIARHCDAIVDRVVQYQESLRPDVAFD